MFQFSKSSKNKKETCCYDLQMALDLLMSWQIMDFTILYGHRTPEFQNKLFRKGRKFNMETELWEIENKDLIVTNKDGFISKSKHNYFPSHAVDIAPYIEEQGIILGSFPKNYSKLTSSQKEKALKKREIEIDQIMILAGLMQAACKVIDFDFTWGGNWDQDGEPLSDQTFMDLLHFQYNTKE